MVSTLGKAQGIFHLDDSDHTVGSYFIYDDVKKIYNTSDEYLNKLPFINKEELYVIDEIKLYKAWSAGTLNGVIPKKGTSLDEALLKYMIKRTYPTAIIESQEQIGRYKMDLKITLDRNTKYIEYDGPNHYCISRYGPPTRHPFEKKKTIEDKTGIEVIIWPYWIQRCESNIKTIFDKNTKGYGALWSTNYHFGDFVFEDSAQIIKQITKRFNAWDESDGICNFYEKDSLNRIKPEHPILEKIKKGKIGKEKILPTGYTNETFWVPSILR